MGLIALGRPSAGRAGVRRGWSVAGRWSGPCSAGTRRCFRRDRRSRSRGCSGGCAPPCWTGCCWRLLERSPAGHGCHPWWHRERRRLARAARGCPAVLPACFLPLLPPELLRFFGKRPCCRLPLLRASHWKKRAEGVPSAFRVQWDWKTTPRARQSGRWEWVRIVAVYSS